MKARILGCFLMVSLLGCGSITGKPFIPLSLSEMEAMRGIAFASAGHRIQSSASIPAEVTKPFIPSVRGQEREFRSKSSSEPASGFSSLFQAAVKAFPSPPKVDTSPPSKSEPPALKAPPIDTRPVVTCYLMKWGPCPPCIHLDADIDQMTQAEKDSAPFVFRKVNLKSPDEIPKEFEDVEGLVFPFLVWNIGEARWMQLNWFGLAKFRETFDGSTSPEKLKAMQAQACTNPLCRCQNCQCNPCKCGQIVPSTNGGGCGPNGCPQMRAGRKGRRVAMQPPPSNPQPMTVEAMTAQALPRDLIQQILNSVGKEVPLTPQASFIVPASGGVKFQKTGDTLSLDLAEPWPMLRYKTWGIRFDDFLKGIALSPTLAVVKLKSYGDVKFAVE